jgi:hypothetical protein
MQRVIGWVAGAALIQATLLLVLGWLLPGPTITSLPVGILAGILVAATLGLSWGSVYWIAARLSPALFPSSDFSSPASPRPRRSSERRCCTRA